MDRFDEKNQGRFNQDTPASRGVEFSGAQGNEERKESTRNINSGQQGSTSPSGLNRFIGAGIMWGLSFFTDESCHVNLTAGSGITSDGKIINFDKPFKFRYYEVFFDPALPINTAFSSNTPGASLNAVDYFTQPVPEYGNQSRITGDYPMFRLFESREGFDDRIALKPQTSIVENEIEVVDSSFFAEDAPSDPYTIRDLDKWVLTLFLENPESNTILPLLLHRDDAKRILELSGEIANAPVPVEQEDEPVGLPTLFRQRGGDAEGETYNRYNRGKQINEIPIRRFGYSSFDKLGLEDMIYPDLPEDEIPFLRIFKEYVNIVENCLSSLSEGIEKIHEVYKDYLGGNQIRYVNAFFRLFFRRYADYLERTKKEIHPINDVVLGPDSEWIVVGENNHFWYSDNLVKSLQNRLKELEQQGTEAPKIFLGPKRQYAIIGSEADDIHYNNRLPRNLRYLLDRFKEQFIKVHQLVFLPDKRWILLVEDNFVGLSNEEKLQDYELGPDGTFKQKVTDIESNSDQEIKYVVVAGEDKSQDASDPFDVSILFMDSNSPQSNLVARKEDVADTLFHPMRYIENVFSAYKAGSISQVITGPVGEMMILYQHQDKTKLAPPYSDLELQNNGVQFLVDIPLININYPTILSTKLNTLLESKNITKVSIGPLGSYLILSDEPTGYWYSGTVPNELKVELSKRNGGGHVSIFCIYDFVNNLVETYNELLKEFSFLNINTPEENSFSNHLFLGILEEGITFQKSLYRHYFKQPPIFNENSDRLDRIKFLHWRFVIMINSFSIPDPNYDKRIEFDNPSDEDYRDILKEGEDTFPDTYEEMSLKITPSRMPTDPLDQQAIPFYYYLSNSYYSLQHYWSFEKTKSNQEDHIFSYHASYAADSYTQLTRTIQPFAFQLEDYPFYRVEGALGKYLYTSAAENGVQLDGVLMQLLSYRNRYNLSFDVQVMPLSDFILLFDKLLYEKTGDIGREPQLEERLASKYIQLSEKRGLEHLGGVVKGGTYVLIYDDQSGGEKRIVGDFSLPHYCCAPDENQIDDPAPLQELNLIVLDGLGRTRGENIPVMDVVLKIGKQMALPTNEEGKTSLELFPGTYHLNIDSNVYELFEPKILEVTDLNLNLPTLNRSILEGETPPVEVYLQRLYALVFIVLSPDTVDEGLVDINNIEVTLKSDGSNRSLVDEGYMYELLSVIGEGNKTIQEIYNLNDYHITYAVPLKIPKGKQVITINVKDSDMEPIDLSVVANPSTITEYYLLIDEFLDDFEVKKDKEDIIPSDRDTPIDIIFNTIGETTDEEAPILSLTEINGIEKEDEEKLKNFDRIKRRQIQYLEQVSKLPENQFGFIEKKLRLPSGTISQQNWKGQAISILALKDLRNDPYLEYRGEKDDLTQITQIDKDLEKRLNELTFQGGVKGIRYFGRFIKIKPSSYSTLESLLGIPLNTIKKEEWAKQAEEFMMNKLFDSIGESGDTVDELNVLIAPITPEIELVLKNLDGNNRGISKISQVYKLGLKVEAHEIVETIINREIGGEKRYKFIKLEDWGGIAEGILLEKLFEKIGKVNSDRANDLTLISGIDVSLESQLNDIYIKNSGDAGIFAYRQIASLGEMEKDFLETKLGLQPGTISLNKWSVQATEILLNQLFEQVKEANPGDRDDLTLISGITNERQSDLATLGGDGQGITTYQQIRRLNDQTIEIVEYFIGIEIGTINVQDWINEAEKLIFDSLFRVIGLGDASNPDDLTEISGIDANIQTKLNNIDVVNSRIINLFSQIAKLPLDQFEFLEEKLGITIGTIEVENWVGQAKSLNQFDDLFNEIGLANPSEKDELTLIDTITSEIELKLNNIDINKARGIYRFNQLLHLDVVNHQLLVEKSIGLDLGTISNESWVEKAKDILVLMLKEDLGFSKLLLPSLEEEEAKLLSIINNEAIVKGLKEQFGISLIRQLMYLPNGYHPVIEKVLELEKGAIERDDWSGKAESIAVDFVLTVISQEVSSETIERDELTFIPGINDELKLKLNQLDPLNNRGISTFKELAALPANLNDVIEFKLGIAKNTIVKENWKEIAQRFFDLFETIGKAKNEERDNLQEIEGIDSTATEQKLNSVGVFSFKQIAKFNDLTNDQIRFLEEMAGFPFGTIEKEEWADEADDLIEN